MQPRSRFARLINKLKEVNAGNDNYEDNLRPVVEYQVTDHYSAKLKKIGDTYREMGMQTEAASIYGRMGAMKRLTPKLLDDLGAENVSLAQTIEQNMVGKGRSGYKLTGTLMKSIGKHTTEDGRVQIYPLAKADKGKGAEYGGFVEYGTRLHPVPEPFMYQSWKQMQPYIDKKLDEFLAGWKLEV